MAAVVCVPCRLFQFVFYQLFGREQLTFGPLKPSRGRRRYLPQWRDLISPGWKRSPMISNATRVDKSQRTGASRIQSKEQSHVVLNAAYPAIPRAADQAR
jgi:hypothetical protein